MYDNIIQIRVVYDVDSLVEYDFSIENYIFFFQYNFSFTHFDIYMFLFIGVVSIRYVFRRI